MADSEDSRTVGVHRGCVQGALAAIAFTVGASLAVAAGALVLFLVVPHGEQFVGSERIRSLLALVSFVVFISIPVYLLSIRCIRRSR
ncbi:MAG: hypothetical protein RI560_02645 [Natronomonas sp.]|uniref:hypothetical protein n=1 Tax=Natronomonas sp. TaxID=2184060 RepID=UPI0028703CBF|nr:hypothetical protein [Natronomonas sp.]MDR9380558.1 hypothetical protein [Natronomonas sp.]MDR9429320.1 hypothetical protein [Natronomonas sp.]